MEPNWLQYPNLLTAVLVLFISFKTFQYLYKKPKIFIDDIDLLEINSHKIASKMIVRIHNPAENKNLIIKYKVRAFPCGKIVAKNEAGIELSECHAHDMVILFNQEAEMREGQWGMLILYDIKGRRILKLFRLTE